MTENLVIPKAEDWNRVIAAIGRPQHRSDPRRRVDDALIFLPGQPVPVTNNASTLAPKGGFAWCNGSAGSDSEHLGIVQPQSPGIAATLVIIDDDIPPGANGLGWPMDGCEHPVLFAATSAQVAQRVGPAAALGVAPQGASWAGMLNPLGPVTITQAAASTGLAQAILHGQRGGMKMIRTGSGATAGRPVKVLVFSSRFTLTQTAPGDVTVSGGGS